MIYLEFLNGTEENISKISLKTKYKIEQNFFFGQHHTVKGKRKVVSCPEKVN